MKILGVVNAIAIFMLLMAIGATPETLVPYEATCSDIIGGTSIVIIAINSLIITFAIFMNEY